MVNSEGGDHGPQNKITGVLFMDSNWILHGEVWSVRHCVFSEWSPLTYIIALYEWSKTYVWACKSESS